MRTLVELFKVMKANKQLYKTKECTGLCRFSKLLQLGGIINNNEYHKVLEYIDQHRPKLGSKYYTEYSRESAWYWPLRRWYPRLLWINAQIKLLSKKK